MEVLSVDNVPVGLAETKEGIYVTAIGSVTPSEKQNGALLFFPNGEGRFGKRQVIMEGLPRAVQTVPEDLNGDGRTDLVLCLFGNHRGRFSWFENLGGTYREHVLLDKPGAIRCVAHDFNGDGFPDLGVLIAQDT
jgi:hypothetical protein